MSVQISRKGTHVSIKNRYNHTVGNPDNTLDSDLDNVAYGLKRAVYTRVGREDLMDKTSVALAEGYIADNEGGIHAYKYEENNIYYGDYEYIENGVVTTIDRGQYVMISPQLYAPRNGKGDELNLRPSYEGAELAVGEDIRFLYKSNEAKGNEKDSRLAELRQEYAERDKAELALKLHETLAKQARPAYDAYKDVVTQLGGEMMSEVDFASLLEHKIVEWQENGTIDHLVRELIEEGSHPNIVASPNIIADWSQLKNLAEKFGKDQPLATYTYDELFSMYTAEQLSGPLQGEASVRLSIIPSTYNRRLDYKNVKDQRTELASMQEEQPQLNFRVPSVLDTITYWHSLRATRGRLEGDGTSQTTYIRHFDLPEKAVGGWSFVPGSLVFVGGGARLDYSDADVGYGARVAVG
jgi:hypothetical protein